MSAVTAAEARASFTDAERAAIFEPIHRRGDRLMTWFLGGHTLLALGLAAYNGTWLASVLIASVAIGSFAASAVLFPGSFLTRCIAGISLQTFTALHIYQLDGLAEMHFWYFTGFTMMIVYQDWVSFWPGTVLILAQHALFALLHNGGMQVHFFEDEVVTLNKIVWHFGIALVQPAICGYWAKLLNDQTVTEAWRQRRLEQTSAALDEQLTLVRDREAALQRSSARLQEASRLQRAILDNIPDMAWVKDADGRYLSANRAFQRAAGLPLEQILGRTSDDVFAGDFPDHARRTNAEVMRERVIVRHEERVVTRDGRELEVETIRAPLINERSEVVGTIGLARDLTERRRLDAERRALETQLQEAQKLESLGVLAGGIAHDFNNLLLGILGNAGLARLELPTGAPVQESLQEIEHAAGRAAELTKQMLAYAGKGRMVIERVSLSRLARELQPLFGSALATRGQIDLVLADDLPEVDADAAQLRQVMLNLVTNAAEALEGTTARVRVVTHRVELTAPFITTGAAQRLEPGVYAVFEVEDTGTGIPATDLGRIFEPFFSTRFAGRGLGLPAVLGIVRGHGGGVDVHSEVGTGTTVRVYLPASAAVPAPASPSDASAEATAVCAGLTVLVVDDEDVVRAVAERMLENLGAVVRTASTAADAMAAVSLDGNGIDVMLLDLSLPDRRGLDVLADLRAHGVPVRILGTSGVADPSVAARFLEAGAHGFLEKPFTLRGLGAAIRQAMATPAA